MESYENQNKQVSEVAPEDIEQIIQNVDAAVIPKDLHHYLREIYRLSRANCAYPGRNYDEDFQKEEEKLKSELQAKGLAMDSDVIDTLIKKIKENAEKAGKLDAEELKKIDPELKNATVNLEEVVLRPRSEWPKDGTEEN